MTDRSHSRGPRRPYGSASQHPSHPNASQREARREQSRRRVRRRRQLVIGVFLFAALIAGGYLVVWSPASSPREPAVSNPPPASPSPAGSPTAPVATTPPPVLSQPGDFPSAGPGTFDFASGEGDVLGQDGTLLRFRLAVEDTVDEDIDELVEFAEETFAAADGWTAGGEHRFQRVPEQAAYDFTIYLATGGTTAEMCARGGLDVMAANLPDGGVSCYYTGHVMINLNRWRLSVPHYIEQDVPLSVYRTMVFNHEVGHALGLGHEACPGDGEPAPVMQQQTIDLAGCDAYGWPYLDGQRYTGQPVP